MKKESILGQFAKYTSLNVAGMIGLSCYILADTFFISKGLGADGLAALNLAIPVYNFINGTGLMMGMGGATRYSILKGQNEEEKANQYFTTCVKNPMAYTSFGYCCALPFNTFAANWIAFPPS